MKQCKYTGCERKYKCLNMCAYHYNKTGNIKWRTSDKGRTYHVWYTMIWRCSRTSGRYYKYYGSRGITVCERWLSFDNFVADMGYQPPKLTIERIDNELGYNPSNCKWATQKEQMNNMRRNRNYVKSLQVS